MKKYLPVIFLFITSFGAAQKRVENKPNNNQRAGRVTQSSLELLASASEKFIKTDPEKGKDTARKYFDLAQKQNNSLHIANAVRLLAAMERGTGNRQVLFYYDSLYVHYAEKTGVPDTLFNALQLYSRDLMSSNQLSGALPLVTRASAIADSLNKPGLQRKAEFNLGFYYLKKFNPIQAYAHFKKSNDIAVKEKDEYNTATSKLWMAYAAIYMGKTDSSIALIFEALEYHEKNKNYSDIGDCYEDLGFAYQAYGNTSKAIEYYQKSREIFLREKDNLKIAGQSLKLAPLYSIRKQFDTALYYAKDAESWYKQVNYNVGIAMAKSVVGQVYSENGETEKAKLYFSESAEINKKEKNDLLSIYNGGVNAVNLAKEGKFHEADSLLASATEKVKQVLPTKLIQSAHNRMRQNHIPFSAIEQKTFGGLVGSVLINPGEQDRMTFINPYTVAPSSMDSSIGALYNNQLQEMETRYRTRLKDDSLRIEKQNAVVALNTLKTRNYFLLGVGLVSLMLAAGLCLLYFSRKRAIRDKAKIELLQNEIHHRVKNNLGVVRRLVEVAGKSVDDQAPMRSLQNRIAAIELLHERLYQDEAAPGRVALQPYLEELVRLIRSTFQTHADIDISVKADVDIDIDAADKLGLIINELVTNSLKYAFIGRASGNILIVMQYKDEYHLIVSDDGQGFDSAHKYKSYGMRLIKGLSNEINGRYQFTNEQGTKFELYFKG